MVSFPAAKYLVSRTLTMKMEEIPLGVIQREIIITP